MSDSRVFFTISSIEYSRFLALFSTQRSFPLEYRDWLEAHTDEIALLKASGVQVREQVVLHQEFVTWCEARNQSTNLKSLQVFAEQKASSSAARPSTNEPKYAG